MPKTTLAVVVPAYNEEVVIKSSLKSLTKVINKKNIYVVSDGSKDKTSIIAKQIVPNVLSLRKNRGKAGALDMLLNKYKLCDRYEYIFFFDADTQITKDFVKEIEKVIKARRPSLVVGTVTSSKKGLISAYRVFEYGFSHMFFKKAQDIIGTIVVAPGCASIYRADVLKKLDFSRRTLTEDLDLTMQIHSKRLGNIVYCPKAKVITQDPDTFSDYWNQINRWNTGFWQNYFIHRLYIPKSKINNQIWLLMLDFILWISVLVLSVTHPIEILKLYLYAFALSAILGTVVSIITAQYWAILYSPMFGLFQLANTISFVYSFPRAIVGQKISLGWQKVARY